MTTTPPRAERHHLADALSAIEYCYEQGWTDGLPVVPPTEDRVAAMLDYVGVAPAQVVGRNLVRDRTATAEKVAVNAVMAGCRIEYFPVVLAIVEAMTDDAYNLHGSSISTGGSAPLVICNGPLTRELGINSGVNLFGPGNRANATIGRTVRLLILNVFGGTPGVLDKSCFGHPGKYTYCIAEDEANSPWTPFHVERGFKREESTVTIMAMEGPHQVNVAGPSDPEVILSAVADTMRGTGTMLASGPSVGEYVVIFSPELRRILHGKGCDKESIRQYLATHAGRTAEYLKKHGLLLGAPEPSDATKWVPTVRSAEGIFVLTGGGDAGPFTICIPPWGRGLNSKAVTRAVRPPARSKA
ncbi:MAG: hypothetical protein Q7T26_10145 [Dehalococcoidia bacterium]|nr:hypothetical protein [Dehalococcoidia bacterium]